MTRKGGKGPLTPEDRAAWRAYTDDVRRLLREQSEADEGADELTGGETPESRGLAKSPPEVPPVTASGKTRPSPRGVAGNGLDGHVTRRLRKGLVPLGGTLDLHGMTQETALARLQAFVTDGHRRGARLLLVVTGKSRPSDAESGSTERGILNRRLPDWVALPPLDAFVLKALPAAPRHGGSGAYYLYLRRVRD